MAGALVLLGIFIWAFRRNLDVATEAGRGRGASSVLTALKSKWAVLGGVAIFLYVGAEVSIGSAMTNFLNYHDMLGVSLRDAGHRGGVLLGRRDGGPIHRQRAADQKCRRRVCSRSSRRSPR